MIELIELLADLATIGSFLIAVVLLAKTGRK